MEPCHESSWAISDDSDVINGLWGGGSYDLWTGGGTAGSRSSGVADGRLSGTSSGRPSHVTRVSRLNRLRSSL